MDGMKSAIIKVDEDQHLVFGWASVASENDQPVVDSQGDLLDEATLEKAAYEFVLSSRRGGVMHRAIIGKLVESIVFTKEKQKALGIDLGQAGWFVGFKIDDPLVWQRVKNGDFAGFSIHGRARRMDI
jgi:hypothetical protein